MNCPIRCMAACLVLAATTLSSADDRQETLPPRISFDELEEGSPKAVSILGTFFRTRSGDFINFIPADAKAKGVWMRNLTAEVKEEALKQIKPSQHVPVIVRCDITVEPAADPPDRPNGVTTGAYFGPFNVATVTAATYLTEAQATEKAETLITDQAQRSRFLARFK